MKIYKFVNNSLSIIEDKNEVLERLQEYYTPTKAMNSYNFFLMCRTDGLEAVKKRMSKTAYYRYLKTLKDLNIDVSQKYDIIEHENLIVQFNPFTAIEVY